MSCISITIDVYVVQRKTSGPRRQQVLLYKLGKAIASQDKGALLRTQHAKREERNSALTCRILKLFLVRLCVGELSQNPFCLHGSARRGVHVMRSPISSAAAAPGKPCPPVLSTSGHRTSAAAADPWLPTLLFAPQNCPGPIFMGYF